jgi:formylglycine-generating enzyme required for sulfatase activity
MGKAEEVWASLRHSPDPRLRSFIINWLSPLGVDPKLIAAEFDRIDDNAMPTPAPGQQKMDTILFHPETSMRRALILALGTYGTEGLSPGEREPLIGKLLDLYRNDPDAGIHGAAEWTMRKWGQQGKLKEADYELMTMKNGGNRRWFINSQGQTFAVIDGPVGFLMGSPPSDPHHRSNQAPLWRIITRRFAVSFQEVTAGWYQKFLQNKPRGGSAPPSANLASLDAQGPIINVTWYDAAAYCNWLSEKEGLPRNQWCYLIGAEGGWSDAVTVPEDVLRRTGYRLLTEAEWEYTCRAGGITSRYYGLSTDLLGNYSWYDVNSRKTPKPCGTLIPNDLGLFDMLGNVWEWCLDEYKPYQAGYRGKVFDERDSKERVTIKTFRVMRGGSCEFFERLIGSSYRDWMKPPMSFTDGGFRIARTIP